MRILPVADYYTQNNKKPTETFGMSKGLSSIAVALPKAKPEFFPLSSKICSLMNPNTIELNPDHLKRLNNLYYKAENNKVPITQNDLCKLDEFFFPIGIKIPAFKELFIKLGINKIEELINNAVKTNKSINYT